MSESRSDELAEFRLLLAKVEKMRAAQKRYFRSRDNLAECKALERDVDGLIASITDRQPSLFGSDDE